MQFLSLNIHCQNSQTLQRIIIPSHNLYRKLSFHKARFLPELLKYVQQNILELEKACKIFPLESRIHFRNHWQFQINQIFQFIHNVVESSIFSQIYSSRIGKRGMQTRNQFQFCFLFLKWFSVITLENQYHDFFKLSLGNSWHNLCQQVLACLCTLNSHKLVMETHIC